jgi:hypothetical protein
VRTVSVETPEPVTVLGAKAHVGGEVTAGTMLLQDKLSVPLKPFRGLMVMVEVTDPPAATVAGQSVEAVSVKSAGAM